MRFVAEGPNIPDRLLEVRDEGWVVFVCGAGVSKPAGMPDFVRLTRDVLDHLQAPDDLPARQAFAAWTDDTTPVSVRTPLDQIFNSLLYEYSRNHRDKYSRDQINRIVAEQLTSSSSAPTPREHSIVARLSANKEGIPQIVTTNFDRLFEQPGVTEDLKVFEPPTFPDLRYNQPVSGLTYLHGRLQTDNARPHDYILSSADFGRAYLAEGWATRFVRLLLEKYTVVLLGYQADDPPVRYLLQGLNSTSALDDGRLYAFDRGSPEEIEAKWRDRGVRPIAYPGDGCDHSSLWNSLEEWANRADDQAAWRDSVIDMARRGPSVLQPHERGQVAHLVQTNLGAKDFADATPTPPAEWLCVFDSLCRLAKAEKAPGSDDEFEPRRRYALDDDPAVQPEDGPVGDDLIAWLGGDNRPTSDFRLSRRAAGGFEMLPRRLHHLGRWIAANSFEPIVAWWAARQYCLHPRLHAMILARLDGGKAVPESARQVWNLILESLEHNDQNALDVNWPAMRRRIEREGWTPSALRDLERYTEPFIKVGRMTGRRRVEPPSAPWSKIQQSDIAHFEVEFPNQGDEPLDVPDDAVCAVFALASRNLVRGLQRLEETGQRWFHKMTLYPDDDAPSVHYQSPAEKYVSWVADLMQRAGCSDPMVVKATISLWPTGERVILNKLRLFAWNLHSVFSAEEVIASLMAMDQDAFWNSGNRREFLFLLRGRWNDFTAQSREEVLGRLLAGRDRFSKEELDEYPERRDMDLMSRLRWMEKNGCALTGEMMDRIAEVQARLPEWIDAWADNAARSLEGRIGGVDMVSDASVFDGAPISRIVEIARKHTHGSVAEFKDYRPFVGLVRAQPRRALSALAHSGRKGEYPSDLWDALVREWPGAAPPRATQLFCERLRRLPANVVHDNVHTISRWMKEKLPAIAADDEARALAVFDDLLARLLSGRPEVTDSGIGETSVGGHVIERSRRTIDHAINAPMGHATEALISILDARQLPKDHGMPEEFASRFQRLLDAPGEGSDHAVCLLTQQLAWLNDIAPEWVMTHMLPRFSLDHSDSEPAWNGLLWGNGIVGPELFKAIKDPFLQLFTRIYEWRWDDEAIRPAHQWLVMTAIRHEQEPRYTSFDEAREAMRRLSDKGRSDVVYHLVRVGQGNDSGWIEFVIPFLRDAWPKQAKFQTESTSVAFLSMLVASGDAFPRVLETVHDFLRPIRQAHYLFYRFHRAVADDEEPIPSRFPSKTLELMSIIVPDDPHEVYYGLGAVLALLSEAAPELTGDPRYHRLEELLAAR